MAWAQVVLGAYQAAVNYTDKKDDQFKADQVFKQRQNQTYKTPIELYKQQNALEQRAQSGFAPEELSYLTGQTNQAFQDSLYTSQVLGGDPNSFASMFNNHVNDIMRIEGANHSERMKNFDAFINSFSTIADSKTAERISQDNLLKDQMQSIQAGRIEAAKGEQSGLNSILAGASAMSSNSLYKDNNFIEKGKFYNAYGDQWNDAYDYAKGNGLSFNQYKKKFNKAADDINSGIGSTTF